MNIKEKLKDLKILDKNSINPNIIIIILLSILVLIISNSFNFSESNTTFGNVNENGLSDAQQVIANEKIATYEEEVESKLKGTLEKIKGVGNVNVMISFEGGEEYVPALNISGSQSTTEEDDGEGGTRLIKQYTDGETIVMKGDGTITEPFIIKSYNPKIQGIVIVAEGAKDEYIKLQIEKVVITLFDLPKNKVTVCTGEK